MTTRWMSIAVVATLVAIATSGLAQAQGRRGGGMVGNRGGGAARPGGGFGGSPSFSAPAARPSPGIANRPGGFNPGAVGQPGGGGINRPNPGGTPGQRPNPGDRPGQGGGGIGNRPPFGGIGGGNGQGPGNIGGNRPGAGGQGPGNIGGNRPGAGTLPARPPQPGGPGNRPGQGGDGVNRPGGGLVGNRPGTGAGRPGYGDNLGVGNRPNIGNNVNRPINSGNTNVNRPNIGNNTNVNRPINSGNVNVNRPTNVVGNNIGSNNVVNRSTNINNINNYGNINRPVGNWGGGYGYSGGYRGGYRGYWANPYASYHAGWVNGYWNGNYARGSGWGWNNWGMNALGLGLGIGVASWGLGSLWNTWGYSTYANPYYQTAVVQPSTVVVQPVVYDYSRPLDLTSPAPAPAVVDQAVASLDSARASFRSGDYTQALQLADQAIQQTPNDPMLHEFRALCLFALGRYDEAAAPMYTVLSSGPGWDWTTLSGLYPDVEIYTRQLRALEAYCTANPQAASARFLLASLYMTQGSNDAAAGILKQVVSLQPRDTLSSQLLAALTSAASTPDQGTPSAPTAPAQQPETQTGAAPGATTNAPTDGNPPDGPPLPAGPVPAKLAGVWSASPAKDVAIALTIDAGKGFTWKVTDRGQTRQFQGQATFDNDVLALVPPDMPPMVGSVKWDDDSHFRFKAIGAPPDDPGLVFGK